MREARNYDRMLTGKDPLPEVLFIGNDCEHGHGVDGKTVRNKKTQACCLCHNLRERVHVAKKYKYHKRLGKHESSKMIDIDHKLAELEDAKLNDDIYGL